jgi:hypothetical protein
MRNTIMDIMKIQTLFHSNLRHLAAQRKGIRGILEQGIINHRNQVKPNILKIHPLDEYGTLVCDKMDLMTTLSQL